MRNTTLTLVDNKLDGTLPTYVEELVSQTLLEFRLQYHYKTNSFISTEGTIFDDKLVLSRLRLDFLEKGNSHLSSYIADSLRIIKESASQTFLGSIRENLKFSGFPSQDLASFVYALTGRDDSIASGVLRHFVWQVKRKLFGLPVDHHMMVCLYGVSGAGKSVAIQKFLGPLSDLKLDSDFSIFNDKFSLGIWEKYFVIFCDEMGEIKNTSVERLKNVITAPRVETRGMRSETIKSVKQNATFIAASNIEIKDLINDPTSARRYFQIDCQPKIDWESINHIDFRSIWKGINEHGPSPLLPILDEVRLIQESSVRAKSLIEQFLEECCEHCDFIPSSPSTQDLYKAFVEFCRLQNISSYEGLQQFSRRLPSLARCLGPIAPKRCYNGTVWPLRVR